MGYGIEVDGGGGRGLVKNGVDATQQPTRAGTSNETASPARRWQKYAQISGWGMYVPHQVVPNERFVELGLDTSNEWIATRTGIERRRVVGDHEATSDMAVRAAKEALRVADMHPNELDLILIATCTPDHIMPSTAALVQDRLGAKNAGAMDLNAACAGFVYALSTGVSYIESGRAKNVLVVGADELSTHLDWKDRSTCVLFGDGAGAVVLHASDEPGVMATTMGSDGSGAGLLTIKAGSRNRQNGTRHKNNGKNGTNGAAAMSDDYYLRMNGPQVFRWATQMMARAAEKVITSSGLTVGQVDLFIPHQANSRILETTARRLGVPIEKVFSNLKDYGNTSAASIPIALCEAVQSGRVKVGDNLVLASFGAGLTWAALAMRWGVAVDTQVSRWKPLGRGVEERVAAVRSVSRRLGWRVRGEIDKRFRKDDDAK
jgi:3-oxoacyl-[acyl-carrier-protein] synthase-3